MWAVVADADRDERRIVEDVLAGSGYLVLGCGNVRQLLAATRRVRPRLVVCELDLLRPLSGAAACRRLGRDGLAPVVVLTLREGGPAPGLALPRTWQILRKPIRTELLLGLALSALADGV